MSTYTFGALFIGQHFSQEEKEMPNPYATYSTRKTPQNEPIPGTVANSAGGYSFAVDEWTQLDRFLVLGTEGGTYYINQKELTRENAKTVEKCIALDGPRVVSRIVEISEGGRAAKNDPAIFALALCFAMGDTYTKRMASEALPKVCRIGTHLFHFAQYVQNMRGWGRSLKRTIANWYDNSQRDLGYQLVKYQQRDGWSHADLIKLSHPKAHGELYDWVLRGKPGHETAPAPDHRTIQGFMHLQQNPDGLTTEEVAATIREYHLPREAVPTGFLTDKTVWAALLETDMGYEALIRNLGNMGKVGLLVSLSDASRTIVARLSDGEALRKARLHPIKILSALRTYGGGKGYRGSGEWPVVSQVADALDGAFYESFKSVEPTGKRTMLALDVSGSMGAALMNMPYLNCREGSAAMALVTANVEPNHMFTCFASGKGKSMHSGYGVALKELNISPRQRLDDVVKSISGIPFGGTDCALPMLGALEKGLDIDTFIIYTDSETWAGNVHPVQALREYREKRGIAAKLVVVGMTSNGFSIADPTDSGMLDVVGFDTETPEVIANFQR